MYKCCAWGEMTLPQDGLVTKKLPLDARIRTIGVDADPRLSSGLMFHVKNGWIGFTLRVSKKVYDSYNVGDTIVFW